VAGALLVAVAGYFGLKYLGNAFTHETTDDAFIAGHVISVAPRIAGQVITVAVVDNQLVHSNDLLVEIDPADFNMTLTQKQAAADAMAASYQSVVAGLEVMLTKLATAKDTVVESQADADAAAAAATRAQADDSRAAKLQQDKTISAQEFDAAQATAQQTAAALNSAKQKVVADTSRVKEAEAEYEATKSAAAMELAKMRQAQADVASAQLNLSYAKIYAPADGRVTRKAVEPGDYVQTGQALLALVPTEVWVEANFKESQLKKMSPGQKARVEIDALGGRSFAAHVESIQAGSGAQFSLLPPENATGNFVKVVQRVPVKIVFDEALPADHTLGPGLSVTPSVAVTGFEFSEWLVVVIAIAAGIIAGLIFGVLARRRASRP
jgi:membrane fusion protein (multidrug efflux system)